MLFSWTQQLSILYGASRAGGRQTSGILVFASSRAGRRLLQKAKNAVVGCFGFNGSFSFLHSHGCPCLTSAPRNPLLEKIYSAFGNDKLLSKGVKPDNIIIFSYYQNSLITKPIRDPCLFFFPFPSASSASCKNQNELSV
jgi:hypothetical protein